MWDPRHLELVRSPEWSAFFRAAGAQDQLHFEWMPHPMRHDFKEPPGWRCRAYELAWQGRFVERTLCEVRAADRFDALQTALDQSGKPISASTWAAFRAFKALMHGPEYIATPSSIEDLL